ncbi:unnamed protein product [Plutella xylostella]|uniref:(diamondback moth) hypothetical protein n=1 Tax=Plutella xylostella TaxID=51655 RepID=A0A8S4DT20_PLUXY|nr:unnamed protein product [Plutella xylostella]
MSSRGELPLELALRGRSTSIATTLVQHSADVEARGARGRTLLHRAVDARDAFSAAFLVSNGADPNLTTKEEGDTALHLIAALTPSSCDADTLDALADVAGELLRRGADVNRQNRKGFTALHQAVIARNQRIFDLLLQQPELDPNLRTMNDEHPPLYYALVDDRRASISSSETLVMNGSNPFDTPVTNKNAFSEDPVEGKTETVVERGFAAKLLEKGCVPNPVYSANGDSLLHILAQGWFEDSAVFLTSHLSNDDVNHTNEAGMSILHAACANGLCRLTTALLEKGANPNLQTSYGELNDTVYRQTPLHLAVLNNHEGCVRAILEAARAERGRPGLDLCDSQGDTPASVALTEVLNKHEGCVRAILEPARAERGRPGLDLCDSQGDAPASVALVEVLNKHEGCVRGRPGLDLCDSQGDTPASFARAEGHKSLVMLLVAGGADPDVRNGAGLTLLHQAIVDEDSRTAAALLDRGADMNALTEAGETPLQLAIHCRLGLVVEALCVRGVDMSRLDANGVPPLWAALDSGQEEVASILVRNGADADCWGPGPDGCEQTLLHKAIDENKESAAMFLIRCGCDVQSPRRSGTEPARDKQTPLHLCCSWGLRDVIQTLLEHGADINARDAEGKTPLHIAIENQHAGIISLVLSQPGLDLSIRDNRGVTPFAAALLAKNNKAAEAVLEKNPNAAEQVDKKGRNFLHVAIQNNDMESVMFLLSVEVDVNSRVQDASLTPPLHLAAAGGTRRSCAACCWPELDLARLTLATIILGSSRMLRKIDVSAAMRVMYDQTVIPYVASVKNLGVIMDCTLSWIPQVDAVSKKMFASFHSLKRLQYFLPLNTKVTLAQSLLFPILDYADVSYLDLTEELLNKLERLQNLCIRFIFGLRKYDHISEYRAQLQWLPIRLRRNTHILNILRTALHIAAAAGQANIVSALVSGGCDYSLADAGGDTALHHAAREGQLQAAAALLQETDVDAARANIKGRNPLHELCWCKKDNAAALCELFLQCMPDYPLDRTDLQGNTPLLLAYMNGQGALCRVLVRAGACLAHENRDGVSIFNYQVATKQLLHRLLDALPAEAPWADSELCQECGTKFTLTMRKHHCRHCGRMLCNKCSSQDVPILKFGQNKPQRVCEICFNVLQVGAS